MDKVSMSYLFSFSRYQTKCFLKFIFRQLMTCRFEDLSWAKLSSNGWQGEKEGKMEIQKFECLENEKSFLDEIKNMFHCF